MKHDRTFEKESRYGSREWTALRLGLSLSNFHSKKSDLQKRGFPHPDPTTNRYLKADVDAWIEHQRQISENGVRLSGDTGGINLDGI